MGGGQGGESHLHSLLESAAPALFPPPPKRALCYGGAGAAVFSEWMSECICMWCVGGDVTHSNTSPRCGCTVRLYLYTCVRGHFGRERVCVCVSLRVGIGRGHVMCRVVLGRSWLGSAGLCAFDWLRGVGGGVCELPGLHFHLGCV